jgi:hypothetical protein
VAPDAPRALELAVLIAASTAATVSRYVALRSWVFARVHRGAGPAPSSPPAATASLETPAA